MLVKGKKDVTSVPVTDAGAQKARIAVLIGPEDGAPNFMMRRIELAPGGCTPHHSHPWEHVVYVLKGEGFLTGEAGELKLKSGDSVFVKPDEVHQFRAREDSQLTFLCSIPRR
jgi:quercetin dioxygenase-like cupin family protein